MPSDVDIVNMAMTLLGQARILALTDTNKQARSSNAIYSAVRDNELRAHIWNFAVVRIQLPALATPPAFFFKNAFQLPDDYLRSIQVGALAPGAWSPGVWGMLGPLGNFTEGSDYKIEGQAIVTNWAAPLNLRYIRRVTDPKLFDASFVNAFACRLAMRLAEDMTGASGKRQLAQTEYKEAIISALRANAIELPPDQLPDNSWIMSRFPG